MWRTAASGVIVGVARAALLGSWRVVIVRLDLDAGVEFSLEGRKREEEKRSECSMACCTRGPLHLFASIAPIRAYRDL
jgi:adenylylsulfate kinase-like enzyme